MSDLNYSSGWKGGSSGNEADSEGEEAYAKEVNETMMKTFNPYLTLQMNQKLIKVHRKKIIQ